MNIIYYTLVFVATCISARELLINLGEASIYIKKKDRETHSPKPGEAGEDIQ